MLKFVFRRIWYGFWVFLGVITIVFFLFTVLPGDPARMMLGQRADITSVEAIQKELGLDRPIWVQYLNYLNDLSPISVHNNSNPGNFFFLNHEKYNVLTHLPVGELSLAIKLPYLRRSYQTNREV
ncbi:MAG TPA: hypothetical protein VLH61_05770, partial [Bacteroidales bacterium]|nr:hypothetical protein [Bacteroidales bacterium]